MRTKEAFLTLIQELEGDMAELERLRNTNQRARERIEAGADDVLDYGALAFTIHTIYGIMENYFLRVSKFFENNLPSDGWHKALVERMALDIPGLRPMLIGDRKTKEDIMEILRFRHKFRNLYGEDLKPDKTAAVQKTLETVLDAFPELHVRFCGRLRAIADRL